MHVCVSVVYTSRMSWAETRRLVYALGVFAFLLLCVSPFVYRYLTIPATCTDGIQNQSESEIDKGGPCIVRAEASILPVTVRFAKAFKVDEGVYSAIGYIENPNRDVGLRDAEYEFVMYDEKGIYVGQRKGRVFIPPQAVIPIFEAKIVTGNQVPVRTDLSFRPARNWEKMERRFDDLQIGEAKQEQVLRKPCAINAFDCVEEYYPRVRASVTNVGLNSFSNVPVTAVVFDASGNAIAASRTVVTTLPPRQKADLVYTWNIPFTTEISRVDIIPVPASR
jgi:hypothetical protein